MRFPLLYSESLANHGLRLVALVFIITFLMASQGAHAHGSMEIPVSRVYNCFLEGPENPQSEACKAAVREGGTQALYDWNGVNRLADGRHREVIPDGKLCSAGKESHKGLDLARADWLTTTISPNQNGNFEFVFLATAPHSTDYFEFYVSKDDYDPTQPLRWDDLEDTPFCTINEVVLENGRYRMNCPLPLDKTGGHVIYCIWQRDDSPEAFYSCSDVIFNNDTNTEWREIGQIRAQQDQPVGSDVIFRLFDSSFRDVETHRHTLNQGMNTADAWPFHLAQKVNADSLLVNIGVLDSSGNVTPIQSAAGNSVYVRSNSEFSFETDFEIPGDDDDDDDNDDDDITTWEANAVYVFGDLVTHQELRYRAKWWTRGDEPISNPTVPWETPWELLDETPDDPEAGTWQSTKTYVARDIVTHAGGDYQAKWWNQNFPPDTPVDKPWETPWERLP